MRRRAEGEGVHMDMGAKRSGAHLALRRRLVVPGRERNARGSLALRLG